MTTDPRVHAISHEVSQDFRTPKEIGALVDALGKPAALTEFLKRELPGGFWVYAFEPWLKSDLENNRRLINEAYERLRPYEPLPGYSTHGFRGAEGG